MSDERFDAATLLRAREEVDRLVEEIKRTGTVAQRLEAARATVDGAATQLIRLADAIEVVAAQLAALRPQEVAAELRVVREQVVHLGRLPAESAHLRNEVAALRRLLLIALVSSALSLAALVVLVVG